jgi:urease subunit alpha
VSVAQPLVIGPQFGAHGASAAELGVTFTNGATDAGAPGRRSVPVRGTRTVRGNDMLHHGVLGDVRVNAGGTQVTLDGVPVDTDPLRYSTLTRRYLL